MQHSDWKMISILGLILGVICLLGGGIAYQYEVIYGGAFGLAIPDYPYRDYSFLLFFGGAVFLVVGFVIDYRVRQELLTQERQPTVTLGYCPNCGTKRDADSKYCKNCGSKF